MLITVVYEMWLLCLNRGLCSNGTKTAIEIGKASIISNLTNFINSSQFHKLKPYGMQISFMLAVA